MQLLRSSMWPPRAHAKSSGQSTLSGCVVQLVTSTRSRIVKPARLHFARTARALRSEASCPNFEVSCPRPNFEPRAHARLTGLTSSRIMLRATGLFHLVSDLHDARCSAVTQPLGSRAATLVAWRASQRA